MSGPFKIGGWLVRPEANSLERAGRVVRVEPRYMDLLVYLARHPGEVVSAAEIHEQVWAGMVVGDHAVYQAVARLRKALGDRSSKPLYIETVPKRGYRLLPPVLPVEQRDAAAAGGPVPRREVSGTTAGAPGRAARSWSLWGGVTVVVVVALVLWAGQADRGPGFDGDQTVAVLPFQALEPQARNAYLAYGLTADLLNQLGKVQGLEVLGQRSIARFREGRQDPQEIGRRLGVDFLVLGKVRTAGGRLEVYIELVDARSGARIWSQRFDRRSEDIFGLQDEVAERVVAALGRRYLPDRAPYRQSPTETTLSAYDFYLLGRFYEKDRNRKSLERSLAMYRKAIATDPELPGGHLGVASVSLLLVYYGELPLFQAEEIAWRHLERALELDPEEVENYGIMGLAHYMRGEYGQAEAMLRRALTRNHNYAAAWLWLGLTLEQEGALQQAIGNYRHAARLEPLSVVVGANLALALQSAGHWEEALEALDRVADPDASSVQYNRVRADLLLRRGELVAAYRHARRALELDPADAMAIAQMALLLEDMGQTQGRQRLFDQLLDRGINGKMGALLIMEKTYVRLDRSTQGRARRLVEQLFLGDQYLAQAEWRRRAAFRGLAATYAGRYDEAVAQLESALRGGSYAIVGTDFDLLACTALAFSEQARGRGQAGAEALAGCEDRLGWARERGWNSQWTAYAAAQIAALKGRPDEAITDLQDLYGSGFNGMGLLENDPLLEAVRPHPGLAALIDKMRERADAAWGSISSAGESDQADQQRQGNAVVPGPS